ncbi:MAG: hypothetical protein ACREVK_05600 [Gammaproteobacteria bacterium]
MIDLVAEHLRFMGEMVRWLIKGFDFLTGVTQFWIGTLAQGLGKVAEMVQNTFAQKIVGGDVKVHPPGY